MVCDPSGDGGEMGMRGREQVEADVRTEDLLREWRCKEIGKSRLKGT